MSDEQVIERALFILEKRMRSHKGFMNNHEDIVAYLRLKLGELECEAFYIFYLDTQNRLIYHEEKFRGTTSSSHIYPREVMKEVIKHNATAIVIAHNHPSGTHEPSPADFSMTSNLMEALSYLGCSVLDHIVVTASSIYSMEQEGTLPLLK